VALAFYVLVIRHVEQGKDGIDPTGAYQSRSALVE